MWIVIKIFTREMALYFYARLFGYYKHLDTLPAYNWFKIMDGDYTYLYKRRINKTPEVFKDFASELFWQMEKVEMGHFDDTLMNELDLKIVVFLLLPIMILNKLILEYHRNDHNF